MKKILLLGSFLFLTACSGGVYHNVACIRQCERVLTAEEVTLGADTLFKFDKYKTQDLLAKGKTELNQLANRIKNNYFAVNKIILIGHTDRLGSEHYNQILGLNRAKTIRRYLQHAGINSEILVESAGETQPVTNGCFDIHQSKALKACLQPDRRVDVKIMGEHKQSQCTNQEKRNVNIIAQ